MCDRQVKENLSIKERLMETLARYEISQNKAAKEMGYTSSVLSQYLNETYKGDTAKVEEAIIKWIARKTEAAERKHVPIVETSVMKQMTRAIRLAHDEKDIALIVSDAGGGKTTTAERYAEENERNTVLIKCSGAMNKKVMTQEIAKQLGLDTYRINFDALVNNVTSTLKEFSRRLINDLGETGLVLIGLPKLVWTIQNLKNDHRQLESRIGVFLRLDGLTKPDAQKIALSVWENASKEVIDSIYDISRKDVRQFVKIINRAQNIMTVNKLSEPDVEVIEMAGSMILRRNYGKGV